MKSVIRSSMLRGSSTKVGKVTRDRSIPTLQKNGSSGELRMTEGNAADLNWAIREEIMEPSSSSLKPAQGISVLVFTRSITEAGSWRDGGRDG